MFECHEACNKDQNVTEDKSILISTLKLFILLCLCCLFFDLLCHTIIQIRSPETQSKCKVLLRIYLVFWIESLLYII